MKIAIFSLATPETRSGNWVTASRWQRSLRSAGHRVAILHEVGQVDDCDAEILIGLHARRSGPALLHFKKLYPERKTIVALSGTDIYRDLSPTRKRQSATAIKSLNTCDQIVLLQPLMAKRMQPVWRSKSTVVMMDEVKRRVPKRNVGKVLQACVVGHLRSEKDPFRAAMAVRDFPQDLSVVVKHVGGARTDSFRQRASLESKRNANWNWLGSVEYREAQSLMRSSDLLVNTSRSEGAPNVLFEAIGHRLPIIASKIDGHVGVLGADYRGYFKTGDTSGLQRLLVRCAKDVGFYQQLLSSMDALAKKYRPGSELKSLLNAVEKV